MRTNVASGANGFDDLIGNIQGAFYWRAEDLDGTGGTNPDVINWTGISITGLTDLQFSGFFASSIADNFENTDFMIVEVDIDGGGFVKILDFRGNRPGGASGGLSQDTDFDGVGDGVELNSTLADFQALIAGTGTTLSLRITVSGESSNEEFAFDHFTVESSVSTAPEMSVSGLGTEIPDGDTTPSPGDDTDFGNVALVGGSNVNTFTITNSGNAVLDLTGSPLVVITGDTADFIVTAQPNNDPVSGGGGTSVFTITFDPTAVGLRTATVSIASDDSDENPYTFVIQGYAGPEIDISGNGASIVDGDTTPSATDHTDFGDVATSGGTFSRTFTITNTGADVLNLTGSPRVAISGANPGDFVVTSQSAGTVVAAGGGTSTFTVEFDPSGVGLRTATITIANDDPSENPYNFDIQGTGRGTTFWTDDFETTAPSQGVRNAPNHANTTDGTIRALATTLCAPTWPAVRMDSMTRLAIFRRILLACRRPGWHRRHEPGRDQLDGHLDHRIDRPAVQRFLCVEYCRQLREHGLHDCRSRYRWRWIRQNSGFPRKSTRRSIRWAESGHRLRWRR